MASIRKEIRLAAFAAPCGSRLLPNELAGAIAGLIDQGLGAMKAHLERKRA